MKENLDFHEALALILENVPRMAAERAPLSDLAGRVLAESPASLVDSPSRDVSLKDGYAVRGSELAQAGAESPVRLRLVGFHGAGDDPGGYLLEGAAVQVMTGAPLPPGADAVLANEYTRESNGHVLCLRNAEPGRNILLRGTDVRAGEPAAERGELIEPGLVGLLAASGLDSALVYGRPRVAVLGTGDEVVEPGRPLQPGQLYASNMVETAAWLRRLGFPSPHVRVLPDRAEELAGALQEAVRECDAVVTSGGAWGSERDLMLGLLDSLGWRGVFHRVRLGPGKATSFGFLEGKPVFILPGGPPSHEAGCLLLALPGLAAMAGRKGHLFPRVIARLEALAKGRAQWTQLVHARLCMTGQGWSAQPLQGDSRLRSMAEKNAYIVLPEGVARLEEGTMAEVILVNPIT